MPQPDLILPLQLKCIAFGTDSNGQKVYGLTYSGIRNITFNLVESQAHTDSIGSLKWTFVSKIVLPIDSRDVSCMLDDQNIFVATFRHDPPSTTSEDYFGGIQYNRYIATRPDALSYTRGYPWRMLNAFYESSYGKELSQVLIESRDYTTLRIITRQVMLTQRQILVRHLYDRSTKLGELRLITAWNLPQPLSDDATGSIRFSDNLLYIFSAKAGSLPSLMTVPYTLESNFFGSSTTTVNTTSTASVCDWDVDYFTAVSGAKFYLLCQKATSFNDRYIPTTWSTNLFVYDSKDPKGSTPKLSAPILLKNLDPSATIDVFKPFGNNDSFPLLGNSVSFDNNASLALLGYSLNGLTYHTELSLSGSNIGITKGATNVTLQVSYDSYNEKPVFAWDPNFQTDGIDISEKIIGAAFGGIASLGLITYFVIRYRRSKKAYQAALAAKRGSEAGSESHVLQSLPPESHSNYNNTANTIDLAEVNSSEGLFPAVYAAPQAMIPPSPVMDRSVPEPSCPATPSIGAAPPNAVLTGASTLTPAPLSAYSTSTAADTTSASTSNSPAVSSYQTEINALGFSRHPRPSIVTTGE
ncbi:hypothetical protein BGX28_002484 [Mortierella sp. GBA30]|nr:hypothetical protein BGX28_002484 [Mortierella sp. GBA30]